MCIGLNMADRLNQKLNDFVNEIEIEFGKLRDKLSTIDLEIGDIRHALEEHIGLDACSGYKYAKKLQDALIKRRSIKNEYQTLQSIKSLSINLLPEIKIIKNKVVELKDRQKLLTYTPRIKNESLQIKNKVESSINKLNRVNKLAIKIKPDPHLDRMTQLFRQIEDERLVKCQ